MNTPEIAPELVQRMCELVRGIAKTGSSAYAIDVLPLYEQAGAINALLPEPVDPDLIEAREFLIRSHGARVSNDYADYARAGCYDDDLGVWLAALKRGRELERGQ